MSFSCFRPFRIWGVTMTFLVKSFQLRFPPRETKKRKKKKNIRSTMACDITSLEVCSIQRGNCSSGSTDNSSKEKGLIIFDNPTVLHYVPLSQCKGQSPFTECFESIVESHFTKLMMEEVTTLKESHFMPLTSLANFLSTKPLNGFVQPLEGLVEHSTLPNGHTTDSFDPKGYKLLAKAGYDFLK